MKLVRWIVLFILIGLPALAHAQAGPGTFSYEGRLYTSTGATSDATVAFKVQIFLESSSTCVLYEETFAPVNLQDTEGLFSLKLGSGTKNPDYHLNLRDAMRNTASSVTLTSGCSYTAALGEGRRAKISVNDGTGTTEFTEYLSIGSSPYSMIADTLEGKPSSDFLWKDTSKNITQTNLENLLASSGYTNLKAVADGNFLSKSAAGGAAIPAVTIAPSGAAAGSMWFDTSTGKLMYHNGSAAQEVGTGATSLTAGTGLAIAAGTISVAAGGISATEIANGTITGAKLASNIAITTSGNISAAAVTATNGTIGSLGTTGLSTKQMDLYDPAAMATKKISVRAPTLANDYTFTFPTTAGTNGQVLSTNGAGVTSWTSPVTTQWSDGASSAISYSAGSVGVGTNAPTTKLDVRGAVRVGTESATCAAGLAGAIRYNSGNVEYCNGTSWTAFAASGAGITSLGGLTANTQTLGIGTTGVIPNWSTSGGNTHVLNIPMAATASVTAGLISKTEYDAFNAKLSPTLTSANLWVGNATNVATAVAPSGDIGLANTGAFTVKGIQGQAVSTTAPSSDGQVLRWNSTTKWTPGFLSMADIRSNVTPTNTILPSAACTADKTLNWSSLTDTFTCQSIAIASSQVTFASVAPGLVFAGPASGPNAAPTFRALAATDLPSGVATQWSNGSSSSIYYSTGFVGVGTNAPKATLDVYGVGASSAILLPRDGTTTRPTGVNGMIRYNTTLNKLEVYEGDAWTSYASSAAAAANGASGAVQFSGGSGVFSSDATNYLWDNTNKRLGIGTTTPTARLTVEESGNSGSSGVIFLRNSTTGGNARSTYSAGNDQAGIHVTTGLTSSTFNDSVFWPDVPSGSGFLRSNAAGGLSISTINNTTGAAIRFSTTDAVGITERMRITRSGFVGVGTNDPKAVLDIYGLSANSAILLPRDATTARPSGVNGMIRYNTSVNTVEVYANGSWASLSTGAGTPAGSSGQIQFNNSGAFGASANLHYDSTNNALILGSTPGYTATNGFIINNPSSATSVFQLHNNQGNLVNDGLLIALTTKDVFFENQEQGKIVFGTFEEDRMALQSDGRITIGTANASANAILDIVSTDTNSAVLLPRATSQNRPTTGVNGMIRYNTSTNTVEAYESGGWATLSGGSASAAGSSNQIQYNSSGSFAGSANFQFYPANSGLSVGPAPSYAATNGGLTLNNTDTGNGIRIHNGNTGATTTDGLVFSLFDTDAILENNEVGSMTLSSNGYDHIVLGQAGGVTIGSSTEATVILDVVSTDTKSAMILPRASTANRPAGVNGMLRYNITLQKLEAYENGAWRQFADPASQWTTGTGAIYYSSGKVGIGTNAPTQLLQVRSTTTDPTLVNVVNTSTAGSAGFSITTGDGSAGKIWSAGSTSAYGTAFEKNLVIEADATFGMNFLTNDTSPIQFFTSGAANPRMMINGSGQVGIGTTSPRAGVIADFYGTTTANSAIMLPRGTLANRPAGINGMLRYNSSANKMEVYEQGNWSNLVNWNTGANSVYTSPGTYVGIGQDPPSTYNLTVGDLTSASVSIGPATMTGAHNSSLFLQARSTSTGGPVVKSEVVAKSDASLEFRIYGSGGTVTAPSVPNYRFMKYNDTASDPAVTISSSSGNVGIGTASPDAPLVVNGIIRNTDVADTDRDIDFSKGNMQYTSANCTTTNNAFILRNMKSGASYTLAIQGTSHTDACSFTIYKDLNTTTYTVHLPIDHGQAPANYHIVYTFVALGSHVYVGWNPMP